jgi:hypothetical protein
VRVNAQTGGGGGCKLACHKHRFSKNLISPCGKTLEVDQLARVSSGLSNLKKEDFEHCRYMDAST